MLGSLFVALGIASCSAAGGHCDSPSTQLVRSEQQQAVHQPSVSISDELDEVQTTPRAQDDSRAARTPR